MTDWEKHVRYEIGDVKRAIFLPDLIMAHLHVELRKEGAVWRGLCPFHSERSPSFKVEEMGGMWRAHCFGCGFDGDVLGVWMAHKGYMKSQFHLALHELAGIAGICGQSVEPVKKKKVEKAVVVPEIVKERVREVAELPWLRPLSWESCGVVGELRGLRPEGVMGAVDQGLLGGEVFGSNKFGELVWGERMAEDGERWGLRCGPHRCWVVGDGAGYCAQVRRMDGGLWTRANGQGFKAWTLGTSKWILGAGLIGSRGKVMAVEGGPDMVAMCDFLLQVHGPGVFDEYAVVGMMGAGIHARADALRFFAGKQVRLFPHVDEVRVKELRRGAVESCPGRDGAERWQEALVGAGAVVDAVDLEAREELVAAGVKDVNDLVKMGAGWMRGEDAGEIFTI